MPTSEDLLWITVRAIDQPISGPKPLARVLEPSFLQKPDKEILKTLEEAEAVNLDKPFASSTHLCMATSTYLLVFLTRA